MRIGQTPSAQEKRGRGLKFVILQLESSVADGQREFAREGATDGDYWSIKSIESSGNSSRRWYKA